MADYRDLLTSDVLKDEMEGRYGRSFVLMLVLRDDASFSGYFLNPYMPGGRNEVFSDYDSFSEKIRRLTEKVKKMDEEDMYVTCFDDWLGSDREAKITLAVHMIVTASGDWMGTVFNPETNTEIRFFNKKQFKNILAP